MFAINANGQNQEDAWKFIEFIHSEQWASLNAQSIELLTRIDVPNTTNPGYNVEAFYQLKPFVDPTGQYGLYTRVYSQAEFAGFMATRPYFEGQMSVDEALAMWEERGNQMIQDVLEQ